MMMKTLLLALFLVLVLHYGEADVSCDTALPELSPCLLYVAGGSNVTEACCDGVRALDNLGQTPADRQSICNCIKTTLGDPDLTPGNLKNALALPSKCGVNLSYPFSPSAECDNAQ